MSTIEDMRRILGDAAAEEIIRRHGGCDWKAPATATGDAYRWLAGIAGPEAAAAFVLAYGGCKIYIPLDHAQSTQARRRRILDDLAAGHSVRETAQRNSVSMRWVRHLRNRTA